jgi:hypothetical protein
MNSSSSLFERKAAQLTYVTPELMECMSEAESMPDTLDFPASRTGAYSAVYNFYIDAADASFGQTKEIVFTATEDSIKIVLAGKGVDQMRLLRKSGSTTEEAELMGLSRKDLVMASTNLRLLADDLTPGQVYTLELHFTASGMTRSLDCQKYSLEVLQVDKVKAAT